MIYSLIFLFDPLGTNLEMMQFVSKQTVLVLGGSDTRQLDGQEENLFLLKGEMEYFSLRTCVLLLQVSP